MTQICIFEDSFCKNLEPLSITRPVYLLRIGIKDILSKILDCVDADHEKHTIVLHCRPDVAHTLTKYKFAINKLAMEDTLFVNGRVLANDDAAKEIVPRNKQEYMLSYSGVPLLARVSAKKMKDFKLSELLSIKNFAPLKLQEKEMEFPVLNYFWDFLQYNAQELTLDAKHTGLLGKHNSSVQGAQLVSANNIFIGKDVVIRPGVVLDASTGPIFIDNQAEIMSQSVIMGPAYIGFKSKIKIGAKIYGPVTIGPVCKIGGEVEGSIIQGYSNKQHEGFLGHAYLGEWVNLGAGTENSDLKNNYHPVDVQLAPGKLIKSQQTFVGCCIGDHTKTGIKTMINTGSVFGCFCNIFGPGYQPKYVPSFTWQDSAAKKPAIYDLAKALQTARAVLSRRGVQLEPAAEKLYKKIFTNRSA